MSSTVAIRCGEAGCPEAERWSAPWSPSPDDLARLRSLSGEQVIDLDERARGAVRVAGRFACGRLRLPSGRVIEIRPKVPTLALLQWLAFTDTVPPLDAWDDDPAIIAGGSLIDAVAHLFVRELAHLTRFHWRPGYHVASDLSLAVRGRVDARRLGKTAGRLPALPCTFRERTMDTIPNRLLARALDATAVIAAGGRLGEECTRTLDRLAREWSAIERELPEPRRALELAVERPPIGYRNALRLARLVLRGGTVDEIDGEGGDVFLVAMNLIWEAGLRRMVGEWAHAHDHRAARDPERTRQWEDAPDAERARWLTVDALLFAPRPIVLDAKYKCAYGNESRNDRFQMAAYAMAFGASAAVLVYPTATGHVPPRRLLRTHVPGSETSDVYAVDLPMALGPDACAAHLGQLLSRLAADATASRHA